MAEYRAAWLIGSIEGMPSQSIKIDGSPFSPTGSNFYLYDATAARSLITAMGALLTSAGVAGPLAYIRRSGYVYLASSGVFTVSWGTSTVMRDLLGFTGNLVGSASYVAPLKSPLLWMPGKPETPMGHRLGTVGQKVNTQYQAVSAYTGRAESVSHGSRTYARYSFPMVDTELVVTTTNEGGTFARWWDEIAMTSARWKLYRDVGEDPAGTTAVHGDLDEPLGPYVCSNTSGNSPRWAFDPSKGFERTDARADIDLRAHLVAEYT